MREQGAEDLGRLGQFLYHSPPLPGLLLCVYLFQFSSLDSLFPGKGVKPREPREFLSTLQLQVDEFLLRGVNRPALALSPLPLPNLGWHQSSNQHSIDMGPSF